MSRATVTHSNIFARIKNVDTFAKYTEKAFLRFVGRFAHGRGYWPTADEMAYAEFRKRKGEPIPEAEYVGLKKRIRDFACDLVLQGDLEIVNPKLCDLRLTAQGWSKTPYEPIEPADNKRQAEQRKYGYRNRVHTIARLEQAAEIVNRRLEELRAEHEKESQHA
jgi:hypothetical protein